MYDEMQMQLKCQLSTLLELLEDIDKRLKSIENKYAESQYCIGHKFTHNYTNFSLDSNNPTVYTKVNLHILFTNTKTEKQDESSCYCFIVLSNPDFLMSTREVCIYPVEHGNTAARIDRDKVISDLMRIIDADMAKESFRRAATRMIEKLIEVQGTKAL
jgi:uncharacterized protein (DUF885 family)